MAEAWGVARRDVRSRALLRSAFSDGEIEAVETEHEIEVRRREAWPSACRQAEISILNSHTDRAEDHNCDHGHDPTSRHVYRSQGRPARERTNVGRRAHRAGRVPALRTPDTGDEVLRS